MREIERIDRENNHQALWAHGCVVRVHYDLPPGLRFTRHLQVIRKETGETSPYFHKYSECLRWAKNPPGLVEPETILAQGHRSTVERKGRRIRVTKDHGETSPWFYKHQQAVRWLEMVPY